MTLEKTAQGWEARLKVSGFGRFAGAAFLGVWLLGWAAGEVFALGILAVGAWSLITGRALERGPRFDSPGAALAVGLFLLVWLTFWTFGGIAAAREFLRLLFGRDRVAANSEGLEIERGYGLFRSRRTVSRDRIVRFYERPGGRGLLVKTTQGSIDITRLGTPVERAELQQALNEFFYVKPEPAREPALPSGWCELSTPEYSTVLARNPDSRRKGAIVSGLVFAVLASVGLYLLPLSLKQRELLPLTLIVAGLAAACGWGALWLRFGRNEWKLENRRLVLQRRFRERCTPLFEAVALELVEDPSSEGDPSYSLTGVAADAPSSSRFHNVGKGRRSIYSRSGASDEPRNFGLWLQARCQLPFTDLTTPEAKTRAHNEAIEQLASSGRLGRAAAKLLKRSRGG